MLDPTTIKKIAIVRLGKIGDLIVTNFAIRKIRSSFPKAHILLVTLPVNRDLLHYTRDVDQVRFYHRGFDMVTLIIFLRKFKADLLLDFNDNPSRTSRSLARFGGAAIKVGFSFGENRRYLTLPVECPPKQSTHVTERLRKIPESIGLTLKDEEILPSMTIGEKELEEVRQHLTRMNPGQAPIIAVNLSAGDPSRYWQVEKWSKLLLKIKGSERVVRFLVLFSPSDERIAMTLAASLPGDSLMWPAYSDFQHFAAYISQANVLISPDTSAIHIACAFRVPVLGLYPAVEWNYQSWRPVGNVSESVRPREGLVPDIDCEDVIDAYSRLRSVLSKTKLGL